LYSTKQNKIFIKLIITIFNSNGSIKFHDFIEKIEDAVNNKNYTLAKIISYYCANAVLNAPSLTNDEKTEIINGILREIDNAEIAENVENSDISNIV
jgi:hypothetical protein